MRVTIKPSANPSQEIDVTKALVGAVATELWKHCGGNDVLNWMEAEEFVEGLMRRSAEAPKVEAERKPRQHPTTPVPVRPRDDALRLTKHRIGADPERITGPLPVF